MGAHQQPHSEGKVVRFIIMISFEKRQSDGYARGPCVMGHESSASRVQTRLAFRTLDFKMQIESLPTFFALICKCCELVTMMNCGDPDHLLRALFSE